MSFLYNSIKKHTNNFVKIKIQTIMKKNLIAAILSAFSVVIYAQEKNTEVFKTKTQFIMKLKMGYSGLDIEDIHKVNGNTSQLELLASSKLNNKMRLEYGLGISEFRGNHQMFESFTDINNQYIRVPVNLIYSKEFSNNASVFSGLGLYGSYLYKSKLFDEIEDKNLGISLGVNLLLGIRFPITSEIETSLNFEYQYDLNEIKGNNVPVNQKLIYSNLLTIGIVYKFNN